MVTVVRGFKDTRAESLGIAVSGFLGRIQESRIDKLQQELMDELAGARDEAGAAAIIADKRFIKVTSDPVRFGNIMSFRDRVPLDRLSVTGYDSDGVQRIVGYNETEDVMEVLRKYGLTLDRDKMFFAQSLDSPESVPINIGMSASRNESFDNLPEELKDVSIRILNSDEAKQATATAISLRTSRIAESKLLISESTLLELQTNPLSAIGKVMTDWRDGQYGPPDSAEAITLKNAILSHMTTIVGRSEFDKKLNIVEDMKKKGIAVANLSRRSLELIEMVLEDPRIPSMVGALDRFFESVGAEISSIGQFAGIKPMSLDQYDFGAFSNQSALFKASLIELAIALAATKGMRGQNFSNFDFKQNLNIVGSSQDRADAFIVTLAGVMANTQEDFRTSWRVMAPTELSFEQQFGAFPSFELESVKRQRTVSKKIKAMLDAEGIDSKFWIEIPEGG